MTAIDLRAARAELESLVYGSVHPTHLTTIVDTAIDDLVAAAQRDRAPLTIPDGARSKVSDDKLRAQVRAMRGHPTLRNVMISDLSGLPDVIDELLARRVAMNEPDGFPAGADVVRITP